MWKVKYTKKFIKELASSPKDIQSRIEPIVFTQLTCDNPFELGYLSKMKGYDDKYKIKELQFAATLIVLLQLWQWKII